MGVCSDRGACSRRRAGKNERNEDENHERCSCNVVSQRGETSRALTRDRLPDLGHGRTVARTLKRQREGTDRMSAEFILDAPLVRSFVTEVEGAIVGANSPGEACETIRPRFASLLADPDWLPANFQAPTPESGMGGGIGQWLLYRAEGGSLSLFSLVVPPGSETPIHDHLAWGLVGLYRGTQDEEIYIRGANGLELVERRALRPGDFYVLIPPRDDIHRVRTTSPETSVSIHLLTNDTGCVLRHTYDADSGTARPFRSGYANVPCDDRSSGV